MLAFKIVALIFVSLADANTESDLTPVTRIMKGKHVASIEDYPFMALIRRAAADYCGGTIISKNFVLSAAQCTVEYVQL